MKLWIGSYMRARRLSPFSEPLRLVLPRSDESPTKGPVLTGGSTELELARPVDVLYDVAVPLSVEGVPDASTVTLSLWHETHRLALLELPLTSLAKGYAGWVKLEPPRPLQDCKGGRLRAMAGCDRGSGNSRLGVRSGCSSTISAARSANCPSPSLGAGRGSRQEGRRTGGGSSTASPTSPNAPPR